MDGKSPDPLAPKTRWRKLHTLLHDKQGVRYFVMAIAIIIGSGLALLGWMRLQVGADIANEYKQTVKERYYSPLTGVEVADEATTKRPVTAIMIENSPDARPQSGLKQAGVVFEAVAEGGITRFVALYQEARPKLIGPVRSVRPYYVDWAAAFDPAVAHVGGSAKALRMIRSGNYGVDIDQFFNPQAYWRASDRYAPHNVYTNFSRLDKLNASKNKKTSTFDGFVRKDDSPAEKPSAKTITMPISSQWYNIRYVYDAKTNSYKRWVGGEKHNDREKGQITPKVAIALMTNMTNVFEDGNRESIKTVGSGTAYIFQDGTVRKCTWSKPAPKKQIVFKDDQGNVIAINRGQTWISALPVGAKPRWQ